MNQTNNSRLLVGGVKLLKDFTAELVVVSVVGGQVQVEGQNLRIARFDENEIEIIGKIENVETISSGKRKL